MRLVWFKRDLRVQDHAALAAVPQGAPVIPLYVYEPDYWALPDTSGRQWAFLRDCLEELNDALSALGAPLVVRRGDVVDILEDLRAQHGVTELLSHEETGNLWTYRRDQRVAAWARGQGVRWKQFPNSGVVRRLEGRDGWAKLRDGRVFAAPIEAPKVLVGPKVLGDGLPEGPPIDCQDRQRGGRKRALSLLGGFLTQRGRTYRADMSSPLAGAEACSRLSPHIAAGTMSIREIALSTSARQKEITDTEWRKSLKSFQSRLAWRDHFIQKLEDQPSIETLCLHSAYEGLRGDDHVRRDAWEKGETGLPFVDACMRSLNATGWLNFRMRSMLMAVASYHLWLDWRATGPHLARMFTDYEPGIHWSQVQMQSGTTGMNTVRIYNPIKQGHDQDPTGVFTRKWLPELSNVPDAYLQEPWLWEGAARLRYPPPIVEPTTAAKHAREQIWAVRKGDAFRREANEVIEKHASRKDRSGRFVNDRARDKTKQSKRNQQLSFDL